MPVNLRNRDFATLVGFSPTEVRFLIQLARDLKAAKYGRYEKPQLVGKNIALIFEKTSTRTRCVGWDMFRGSSGRARSMRRFCIEN